MAVRMRSVLAARVTPPVIRSNGGAFFSSSPIHDAKVIQNRKSHEYNHERARWRSQVSEIRKQSVLEEEQRATDSKKRDDEEIAEAKQKKAKRMRELLARNAETAKRVALERQEGAESFERHLAFTDTVRAGRLSDANKRRQAMIAFLEDQAKKWLSPERVDKEITAELFETPGNIAGHSAERSPYWGYVADVEQLPYKQEPRPGTARAASPRSGTSRNPQEAMALANFIMKDYSSTYREFKLMREDPEGTEGLIHMMQSFEFEDESDEREPMTMAGLKSQAQGGFGSNNDNSSRSGGGSGSVNPYTFRGGAGGWYGSGASQRPTMPRPVQPDEQDKQKIEEQLARLRARRVRPAPDAPVTPPPEA
mmetsp:Transcript_40726/g.82162  ORF Transcript_40726/g.82162 Transcript_40726/m.82162 type:complete len:366 (+) Transcript_40726:16-1113(+)